MGTSSLTTYYGSWPERLSQNAEQPPSIRANPASIIPAVILLEEVNAILDRPSGLTGAATQTFILV
jgi:hypothetical protein